jgi:hypothetical protein
MKYNTISVACIDALKKGTEHVNYTFVGNFQRQLPSALHLPFPPRTRGQTDRASRTTKSHVFKPIEEYDLGNSIRLHRGTALIGLRTWTCVAGNRWKVPSSAGKKTLFGKSPPGKTHSIYLPIHALPVNWQRPPKRVPQVGAMRHWMRRDPRSDRAPSRRRVGYTWMWTCRLLQGLIMKPD